ncbi:helix-turn-helix domain-containing protein [Roseovarius aestuariivivens]|uniref:helix-turn-helix domain-containing protein n=1 Tax=Roseovarius aestuariivivens TaxID=1888910 RepID=UPI001436C579|nr:helix-turn-helix domain-containing protein [Roseovarius aestuariivivens]
MTSSFGTALRATRQALGLSQLALAERLQSTQRHISFLETGRSRITAAFLQRLCSDLALPPAQRGALFEASGLRNPFPERPLDHAAVASALDLIETRILRHWPFPAFALDRDWTVLRANDGARALFAGFGMDLGQSGQSLLALMLSPAFRDAIRNWETVRPILHYRLAAAAERNAHLREALVQSRQAGFFDAPLSAPPDDADPRAADIELPDGTRLRMTPFVGHLVALQEARLDGVEIELMVPLDDASEAALR